MGIVKVGRQSFAGTSVRLSGNGSFSRLYVDEVPVLSFEENIQIRGTDIDARMLVSDGYILVEGVVDRCYVKRCLQVVGRVVRYFVQDRRYFFNGTAKEQLRREKSILTGKLSDGSKKVLINCSGYFSKIIVEKGNPLIKKDVWLKGKVEYIQAGRDLTVKGDVLSARVDESMYVSK